jgi:hypothetical protein
MAVTLIFCYVRQDKDKATKLKNHLSSLEYSGSITIWDYGYIHPGAEWEQEFDKHLDNAQIILLLISDWFLASNYCYKIVMQRAIERHECKEARVIPIILSPVYWQKPPLDKLKPLPDDDRSISEWRQQNAGFKNVAHGINKVVEQWNTHSLPDPAAKRKALIAHFDQLIEAVKAQMQPPERAQKTASTLQQLSIFVPYDVTLADLAAGWYTLSRALQEDEELLISRRRTTCGELANMAAQVTTEQGNLEQAAKTWRIWRDAFKKSDDPRQAAMAKTFARELAQLQEATH